MWTRKNTYSHVIDKLLNVKFAEMSCTVIIQFICQKINQVDLLSDPFYKINQVAVIPPSFPPICSIIKCNINNII